MSNDMSRFALIKYGMIKAEEYLELPDPLHSLAISQLQDSVESFFHLCFDKLGLTITKSTSYLDYFALVEGRIGQAIPQKPTLDSLNKSRVSYKHHGICPSKKEVERYLSVARDFFSSVTQVVFGIPFDSVSIHLLVANSEGRDLLDIGNRHLEIDEIKQAIIHYGAAFIWIKDEFIRGSRNSMFDSPYFLHNKSGPFSSWQQSRDLEELKKNTSNIAELLSVLLLNIDYGKYVKFAGLQPKIMIGATHKDFRILLPTNYTALVTTHADARFCYSFVVECALKWQEMSFSPSYGTSNDSLDDLKKFH